MARIIILSITSHRPQWNKIKNHLSFFKSCKIKKSYGIKIQVHSSGESPPSHSPRQDKTWWTPSRRGRHGLPWATGSQLTTEGLIPWPLPGAPPWHVACGQPALDPDLVCERGRRKGLALWPIGHTCWKLKSDRGGLWAPQHGCTCPWGVVPWRQVKKKHQVWNSESASNTGLHQVWPVLLL